MTPKRIMVMAARIYGITPAQMTGPCREKRVAWPRMAAMATCQRISRATLPQIGRTFHRDHSTVAYAIRRARFLAAHDAVFRTAYQHLCRILEANLRIYISGPTDGTPGLKTPAFTGAASEIARISGCAAVNPQTACEIAVWGRDHDHKSDRDCHELYIRLAILNLMDCDTLVHLNGWNNSRIARLEHEIAETCGLHIFPSLQDFLNARPVQQSSGQKVAA